MIRALFVLMAGVLLTSCITSEEDRIFPFEYKIHDFDSTRLYLSKFVNLLTQTQSAELGYALDSKLYGISEFNSFVKAGLARLTREEVNRAIGEHLRATDLDVTIITADAKGLERQLRARGPAGINYASPPPQQTLDEDAIIGSYKIDLGEIAILPVDFVFEDSCGVLGRRCSDPSFHESCGLGICPFLGLAKIDDAN